MFFHRGSRTAIVPDLVQRFDPATVRGWRRVIMALDGVVGVNGSTPREWRLSFWNRAAARGAKRKILDWNPERVIIAHGEWIRQNVRDALERALSMDRLNASPQLAGRGGWKGPPAFRKMASLRSQNR